MNYDWANLFKTFQFQIKKSESFNDGIDTLITLRKSIMQSFDEIKEKLPRDSFNQIPFNRKSENYNASIIWSLYHVFRIEDIIVNNLIQNTNDIFTSNNFQNAMNSDIITTGNELTIEQILAFSKKIKLSSLYKYIHQVHKSTNNYLSKLEYKETKRKFSNSDKERLQKLNYVDLKDTSWLLDYWCNKNISGLMQMPLSRHWIMHAEVCISIFEKLSN